MLEAETTFQKEMSLWEANGCRKDDHWNNMCILIFNCCSNIAKRICGRFRDEVEDIANSGTYYCIDCIDRLGHRPKALSAYCYLRTSRFLTDPKKINNDQVIPDSYTYDADRDDTILDRIADGRINIEEEIVERLSNE